MSYANIIFSRFDFVLLQIILQEAEIMNRGKTVLLNLCRSYQDMSSTSA